MTQNYRVILLVLLGLLLLAACRQDDAETPSPTTTAVAAEPTPIPDTPTPEPPPAEPIIATAAVDSIEIQTSETFPVEIAIRARGDLPDGCTEINEVLVSQDGTSFNILVTTVRPGDAVCTEALVPFEEIVPLDVAGLPAGTYAINLNGLTGSFTLDVENVPGAQPPTATPDAAASLTPGDTLITGRVWHDLCAVGTGTDGAVITSSNCVSTADGTGFQAEGTLDSGEQGLAGIVVSLGVGECPAEPVLTVETDEDGDFLFDALGAGTYCIFVDESSEDNLPLLPGVWTTENETAVTVTDNDLITDINFGWDFANLPEIVANAEDCTNSIGFTADLNIPDDTEFAPGAAFEKGWQLRNLGTCTWTPEYQFVFTSGDQLPGETAVSLPTTVAPNETIDLYVPFTAPEAVGTYRSEWVMQAPNGQLFGVDGFADEVIWLQIVVSDTAPETAPTAEPNSAVIGGVVWEDICFFTADGTASRGCVEIEDTGIFVGDGSQINEPGLAGITVILAEGVCTTANPLPPANTILATAVTDENGLYRFENLSAGEYCVAIDALSPVNLDFLIPGNWTWPAPGVGQQPAFMVDGEQYLTVDFGWDFQE